MTQHAQDSPETQSVPRWFADFAVKNADEHAALAKEIADVAVKNADEHAALAKEIANNSREIADVKGELRSEIARAEARLTRWMAILFTASLTITLSGLTIAVAVILNFG